MKRIFAHIGFSFAISLIILNFLSVKWALVFLALAIVLFVVFMLVKKTRVAVSFPLCFACAAVAAALYIGCYMGTIEAQEVLYDNSADTEFYITDLEQTGSGGTTYKYFIKTKSIDMAGAPQNIKLVLYSSSQIEADYYEIIKAKLSFYQLADNGYASYGYYGDNIFTSAYTYSYELTGKSVASPLKYVLYAREYIQELFCDILGNEYGGIAVALITGDKSGVSDEILSNFRVAGVIHLLAVSGLHISVLIGTFYWLLKRLAVPKVPRTVLSLFFVLFYIALSGFSKSIIRAGIMMMVLFLARLFNERSDSLNSLGIAVFLICLNPFAVTDVSAQLTVTAVLGILLLYPQLDSRFPVKTKLLSYPVRIFFVSASIFITTFPTMFLFFGTVSTIGALVNIAMIPVGEGALILSTLLLLFGKIPFLSSVIAFLDSVFIRLMVFITENASGISFAMADIGSYVVALLIGALLLLFGVAFLMGKPKAFKTAAAVSLALVICVVAVTAAFQRNEVKLRIVSGYSSDAVLLYDNSSAVVIGVQEYAQYYTVQKIVAANQLSISVLIDPAGNSYAQKLSEEEAVVNYVCADSSVASGAVCENFICTDSFEVQLNENVALQYAYTQDSVALKLYIYSSVFGGSLQDGVFSSSDTLYTINQYGYSEMRMNEWLQ